MDDMLFKNKWIKQVAKLKPKNTNSISLSKSIQAKLMILAMCFMSV